MITRNKIIVLIVLFWIVLLGGILSGSKYIFDTSFSRLEHESAVDVNNRMYQVVLQDLHYLHLMNVDNSYWDDMHQYALNPNKEFEEINLADGELLTDNDINILVLLNRNNTIIWSSAYDLVKKKTVLLPTQVATYLQGHAFQFLKDKKSYNNLIKKEHGIAGFFLSPGDQSITYLSLNYIHDSLGEQPYSGALIFLRHLTSQLMDKLSENFQYKMKIFTLKQLSLSKQGQKVLSELQKQIRVYVDQSNTQYLKTYRFIYDIKHRAIAVLRVDVNRDMFNNIQESSVFHEIVLLILSLVAILGMSILVHWFFAKQERLLNSFSRFVPRQFLSLLNKTDILDVELGDSDEKELSVLFLDIRNFTTILEEMTCEDSFKFVNHFLRNKCSSIVDNHGYIDSYSGDNIMAIFSRSKFHANDAVNAALSMIDTLHADNVKNKLSAGFREIDIGIGINTGTLMLGVIGSAGRLSGTVIGDIVNEASRIETLTKQYAPTLLISASTRDMLKNQEDYVMEFVDEVNVKGKHKTTRVFSILRRDK